MSKIVDDVRGWMETHPQATKEEYEEKRKQLEQVCHPMMTRYALLHLLQYMIIFLHLALGAECIKEQQMACRMSATLLRLTRQAIHLQNLRLKRWTEAAACKHSCEETLKKHIPLFCSCNKSQTKEKKSTSFMPAHTAGLVVSRRPRTPPPPRSARARMPSPPRQEVTFCAADVVDIKTSDLCRQTYPCQHSVSLMLRDGRRVATMLGALDICGVYRSMGSVMPDHFASYLKHGRIPTFSGTQLSGVLARN